MNQGPPSSLSIRAINGDWIPAVQIFTPVCIVSSRYNGNDLTKKLDPVSHEQQSLSFLVRQDVKYEGILPGKKHDLLSLGNLLTLDLIININYNKWFDVLKLLEPVGYCVVLVNYSFAIRYLEQLSRTKQVFLLPGKEKCSTTLLQAKKCYLICFRDSI